MLFTRKKFMFSDFTWQKIFATRFFALPEKDRRNLFYGGDGANICIFMYTSLRKCLFQRGGRILPGGMERGGRLDNFINSKLK